MNRPLIIAHRGDSSRALENSLEAFRLALSIPVDMIEFDVRKSRDNVLYVMHDERTGKTCDIDIDIEMSLGTDIEKVKLRNGELIPTLTDVLTLVNGKVCLNIEVKSNGAGALTAAHIAGLGYKGELLISSFKEHEVLDVKRVLPNVPVAGIFDDFSVSEVSAYKRMDYHFISLRKQTVTQDLVAALHERSIKVYVWTVDEEEEMERLIGWGVDGIYSNKPEVLLRVRNAECGVRNG